MNHDVQVFKALADETRLRAAVALVGGELCLCQFVELLHLAPATLSRHLSLLHRAGLLERRKEGKWVFYKLRVPRSTGDDLLDALLDIIPTLESPSLVLDRKLLPRIRRMDL